MQIYLDIYQDDSNNYLNEIIEKEENLDKYMNILPRSIQIDCLNY